MEQKKRPDLSKRTTRPHSIGGAFGGLMRMLGTRASDADLAKRWAEIMGPEISNLATLAGISKTGMRTMNGKSIGRNMTIRANIPAMATMLSYQAPEIIKRVNKYYGYDAIGRVTIKK